jgi:hypothetical protein
MEDGAKMHQGYANYVKGSCNFNYFHHKWPANSPGLNPIEKVWRWMKGVISQIEPFPTTVDELKRVV